MTRLTRVPCIIKIVVFLGFEFAWQLPFEVQSAEPYSSTPSDQTNRLGITSGIIGGIDPAVTYLTPQSVQIFSTVNTGYDDNFLTSFRPRGSWFTDVGATVSYTHKFPAIVMKLFGDGGATFYNAGDTRAHGSASASFNYQVLRRLTLDLELLGSYQREPNLGANVGPNRIAGNYFQTDDKLNASYDISRRLKSVSSYNFNAFRYENAQAAMFTDRNEHTFGEQLRHAWSRGTTLSAEYRFQAVDYTQASSRDSTTHYLLAGIDETLTRRLHVDCSAGVSIRSFASSGTGTETDPHYEATLAYAINRRANLNITSSYSVEETAERTAFTRTTFRIGGYLTQTVLPKVNASLGVTYSHNNNDQLAANGSLTPAYSEDVFQFSIGMHYQIRPNLALTLGYDHYELNSNLPFSDYARNRYSFGLTYRF